MGIKIKFILISILLLLNIVIYILIQNLELRTEENETAFQRIQSVKRGLKK